MGNPRNMKSSLLLLLACAVGVSAYTCNVYSSSVWSNTSASFPSVVQSTCGYANDQCVTYGYSVTVSLFGISATSEAVAGYCAATSGNGTGYCSTLQSNLAASTTGFATSATAPPPPTATKSATLAPRAPWGVQQPSRWGPPRSWCLVCACSKHLWTESLVCDLQSALLVHVCSVSRKFSSTALTTLMLYKKPLDLQVEKM